MNTPLQHPQILCTQCGGELHPDEGQIFLTCPYCSSAVYLDKSRVVFHWYLAPTLDEEKARGALRRWMAGSQTVKDLDRKAQLTSGTFEYFPVWYFKRRSPDRREEVLLQPAAAISISEILHLNLPAGDLRRYEDHLEAQSHAPTVPLQAALSWLAEQKVPTQEIVEQALVHIPLYTFKYIFNGRQYTALVEGATGQVFANIFPAKNEAPFQLIGAISALVFLCLATFPVIGAISDAEGGAMIGLLICSGAGLVVGAVLFALAAWIAAKI